MNIQKMMKQAQAMQAKMGEMQAQLEASETEGSSGGGLVKIVLTGKKTMRSIHIDASLVKADEKDLLEDMILAAYNDANDKIDSAAAQQMSAMTAGMGLPAGLKLPF